MAPADPRLRALAAGVEARRQALAASPLTRSPSGSKLIALPPLANIALNTSAEAESARREAAAALVRPALSLFSEAAIGRCCGMGGYGKTVPSLRSQAGPGADQWGFLLRRAAAPGTTGSVRPCGHPHNHGLSSNKMALITSDCGTMRSPSMKWP